MQVDFSAWHYFQKCSATSAKAGGGRMISRKLFAYSELRTGASGTRTHDLLHAMQTRSQLRHGPVQADYDKRRAWLQLGRVGRPDADFPARVQLPVSDQGSLQDLHILIRSKR